MAVERGLSDGQVALCVEELLEAARSGEPIAPARVRRPEMTIAPGHG